MAVPGALRLVPEPVRDDRGTSLELFRNSALADAIGRPFVVGQSYWSTSRRNTIRGIHGTVLPPGQEKLVTCARGSVLDVVVDMRVGSPTFGSFDAVVLSADAPAAIYIPDGLGHGFLALTDDACMNYLCSTEFVPGTMIEIDALDPELALPWGLTDEPIRSAKDAAAPTLSAAAAAGLLPGYAECLAFTPAAA
jgi:NDP-hexose 5-epimerase